MELIYDKEDHVARLTLNRPQALNALSPDLLCELRDALVDFEQDDHLRAAVITGAGDKAFCAGADVKTWLPFVQECREKPWLLPDTPMRGLDLKKPLIAAVNGLAYGGGLELCLACDLRLAVEGARFAFPEAKIGLLPRLGGTVRLPRLIPEGLAAEMLFTGRVMDAAEAGECGLVNRVVPADELLPAALDLARRIAANAPLAVRAIKESLTRGRGRSIADALWIENALGLPLYDTEDYQEGRRALAEKRPPEFKGR